MPLDGGVIVTTPQEASLGVVRKGIEMFKKVNVPILGIVENMSYFLRPAASASKFSATVAGKTKPAGRVCRSSEDPNFHRNPQGRRRWRAGRSR